eukprot:TRINITY_DN1123_c0_g1_i1.p1 TRINITY_DN1123_c0_g1~~TRINITY_DN1123_c0_g1_i1.p1  ORF type:complete len:243 (-),score=56.94 TRINITY_DN1123_c0_g1_i1:24-752(-)
MMFARRSAVTFAPFRVAPKLQPLKPVFSFSRPKISVARFATSPTPPPPEPSKSTESHVFDFQWFQGFVQKPFPPEIAEKLEQKSDPLSYEIKPDGLIYLPQAGYRRRLNHVFGPGGWHLIPRGPIIVEADLVRREYALFCHGKFVAQATGDGRINDFGLGRSIATAEEKARSNALSRCCKDLGIAIELWDPSFELEWKKKHALEVWVTNVAKNDGKLKKMWRRKDRPAFGYPLKENPPKFDK